MGATVVVWGDAVGGLPVVVFGSAVVTVAAPVVVVVSVSVSFGDEYEGVVIVESEGCCWLGGGVADGGSSSLAMRVAV